MIREGTLNFGLGAPSICVEYHTRLTTALASSLEDPLTRHRSGSLNLLTEQAMYIYGLTKECLAKRKGTNLHFRQHLSKCMHLCQLIIIQSRKLHLIKQGESRYLKEMKIINEARLTHKQLSHDLSTNLNLEDRMRL